MMVRDFAAQYLSICILESLVGSREDLGRGGKCAAVQVRSERV